MKAKILGFFCSLLIINFAYGQTIDNVLYTNFNNYYKWRGGAFDSTLLIPQTSATNGKRAGALRYSAADSSVYSWTGTQWIKVTGGASIPYVDTLFLQNDTLKYTKNSVNYSVGYVGDDTATVVKAYVTNAEAVTITKGQVVYIFGASGDRAAVKLAKNTSDTFSSKTLGIVRADIAAGAAGWVTTQGQVSGINLGAYTAGDILWLDSVAGGFTKTKPVAPYHSVFVGVVERANAGNGLIYVKPQNGQELGELHDVKITSPTNNQVLAYTAATDIWENKTIDSSYFGGQFKTQVGAAQNAGIQWAGVDSSYAMKIAENGYHFLEEFDVTTSTITTSFDIYGTQFVFSPNSGNLTSTADSSGLGVRIGTSTSASASPIISWGRSGINPNSWRMTFNDWNLFTTRVRIPTLNDGTQRYFVQIGLLQVTNQTNPSGGIFFAYDLDSSMTGSAKSANWQTRTATGNVGTWNQNYTPVAVSANAWVKLSILFKSNIVYFYVNNSLVATHTTNIIGLNDLFYPYFTIRKTNGTTARTLDVDYITHDIKYSTPR